jgi:uncharacterized coiled-coil protein SlyX
MENRVIQRVRVASAIFSTRKELRMAVPWLAVGNLVLGNHDKIIGVVRPGITRKQIETLDSQTDLLNQQIAELQAASAANAEQVRELASQLKDVVAALEQAGVDAARDRAATRRIAYLALALGAAALALGAAALFIQ